MANVLYLAIYRGSDFMKRCSCFQETDSSFQEGNQMLKYDQLFKRYFIPFGANLSCPIGKEIPNDA